MPSRLRDYHRPADLQSARKLLQRAGSRTVPLNTSPRPPLDPYPGVEAVVDLSQLKLNTIKQDGETIRIGGMTLLQEIADSALLRAQAGGVLSQAAHLSAHLGLRNVATLGGAILSTDGPPEVLLALLALDAEQVRDGDLLMEVKFAMQTQSGGAMERVARTPRDQAIVAAVALFEVETPRRGLSLCRHARLAMAGASPSPRRFTSAENILEGQTLSADLLQKLADVVSADADPVPDYRGTAEYRKAMAGVLAIRAIEKAMMNDE